MKYNGSAKYLWSYGADGNVGLHTDLVNNVKWQYQYDLGGNVISVNGNNGTSFNYTYGTDELWYYYDAAGNIVGFELKERHITMSKIFKEILLQ